VPCEPCLKRKVGHSCRLESQYGTARYVARLVTVTDHVPVSHILRIQRLPRQTIHRHISFSLKLTHCASVSVILSARLLGAASSSTLAKRAHALLTPILLSDSIKMEIRGKLQMQVSLENACMVLQLICRHDLGISGTWYGP
jgi:hypothetical protein